MTCDECNRKFNYCFYIDDRFWQLAVGKKEGHLCAHCILERLGGLDWYVILNEPAEKSRLSLEVPEQCNHVWTGQQQGGDPAELGSYEWIAWCEKCGMEKQD